MAVSRPQSLSPHGQHLSASAATVHREQGPALCSQAEPQHEEGTPAEVAGNRGPVPHAGWRASWLSVKHASFESATSTARARQQAARPPSQASRDAAWPAHAPSPGCTTQAGAGAGDRRIHFHAQKPPARSCCRHSSSLKAPRPTIQSPRRVTPNAQEPRRACCSALT